MANTIRVKRRWTGGAGAPSSLKSAELAYSGVDDVLYIGFGDDGSGNATSIKALAGFGSFLGLTGDQTVAGIKTFSSSPVVPTLSAGDNSTKAASTAYVDAAVTGGSVADGDKGDITVSGGGATWTIDTDSVTNAKLANMATSTLKGRVSAGSGDPEDLSVAQARTLLSINNVDNTSDTNKPVSTAQQAALDLKANLASPAFSGIPTVPTAPAGTNTTQAASTAYVIAEIAARLAAADAMVYKGAIDASTNPNYPAADAGDTYRISVAGKIGGVSGPNVEVGDMLICHLDGSAAGTHASVGANWDIIQVNVDGMLTASDIGVSVQGYDATLAGIAALSPAANTGIYATGVDTFATYSLTSAGRALLDDANAAAQRTTLGLGTMATQDANAVAITGGTIDGIIIDGGTY